MVLVLLLGVAFNDCRDRRPRRSKMDTMIRTIYQNSHKYAFVRRGARHSFGEVDEDYVTKQAKYGETGALNCEFSVNLNGFFKKFFLFFSSVGAFCT